MNYLHRMNKILDLITLSCLSIFLCISLSLTGLSSSALSLIIAYYIFNILIILYCQYKNRK